jgi:hypothetical protein
MMPSRYGGNLSVLRGQVCIGTLLIFLRPLVWYQLAEMCGLQDAAQPAIHYVRGNLSVGWRVFIEIYLLGTMEIKERSIQEFKEDFKTSPGLILKTATGDTMSGFQALRHMLALTPLVRLWSKGSSSVPAKRDTAGDCGPPSAAGMHLDSSAWC